VIQLNVILLNAILFAVIMLIINLPNPTLPNVILQHVILLKVTIPRALQIVTIDSFSSKCLLLIVILLGAIVLDVAAPERSHDPF
jgi:hypothetical protein